MTDRRVCIHGHFYQPPRENPWLEAIERQDSAHPYHDWNQRVTAECYAPNAASRMLDERRRIVEIVNNYSRISFNFGATLLSWMEENARFTYERILEADRASRERFGGHGSALAQGYGHVIMPLANRRDKETQVVWGIRDFEDRFGRKPEGMWLPETAVDVECLEVMARHGIRFTILAPHQAKAVRRLDDRDGDGADAEAARASGGAGDASEGGTASPRDAASGSAVDPGGGRPRTEGREEGSTAVAQETGEGRPHAGAGEAEERSPTVAEPATGEPATDEPTPDEPTPDEPGWHDVTGGRVDPTRPYLVELPSGRSIVVFFYDGPVSRGVAFEGLLKNGEAFADRILGVLPDDEEDRLVHIATDGETYGHHHTHGEMALSYALEHIDGTEGVELTNYGEYLEAHPPSWEARIVENSSWSCPHGVERWRSDCGCSTGARPDWDQAWRAPLREALDWLRDAVAPRFEEAAAELLRDPWAARDDYIRVVLHRSRDSVDAFLADHASGDLDERERIRALRLLEIQRHAMLMYTSCGWFFADLSGIETVQVLLYAGRVIQLAEDLFDSPLEEEFLRRLERARSNLPEKGTGRQIYEDAVRPARVDLRNVAAHYAIRSVFDPYEEDEELGEARIYCYGVARGHQHTVEVGRSKMLVGWARFRSRITRESARLSFAAVHAGDHNLLAGVRGFQGQDDYRDVARQLERAFSRGELPEVVRILDREYGTPTYSLRSLFRDEQRDVLDRIFESSVQEAEAVLTQLYRERAPLMRFVAEMGIAQPRVFQVAAEFVLDTRIRSVLSADELDLDRLEELLTGAREGNVRLDPDEIGYAAHRALQRLVDRMAEEPSDGDRLRRLERGTDLLLSLEFEVNTWGAQNAFYRVMREHFAERAAAAEDGDMAAKQWVERFRRIGEKLRVAVP